LKWCQIQLNHYDHGSPFDVYGTCWFAKNEIKSTGIFCAGKNPKLSKARKIMHTQKQKNYQLKTNTYTIGTKFIYISFNCNKSNLT